MEINSNLAHIYIIFVFMGNAFEKLQISKWQGHFMNEFHFVTCTHSSWADRRIVL